MTETPHNLPEAVVNVLHRQINNMETPNFTLDFHGTPDELSEYEIMGMVQNGTITDACEEGGAYRFTIQCDHGYEFWLIVRMPNGDAHGSLTFLTPPT